MLEIDAFGVFSFLPIVMGIVFFLVFLVFAINIFGKVFKHGHRISNKVGDIINKRMDLASQKIEEKLNSNKPEMCEYCSAVIPKDKNECASCGAKRKLK